MHTQEFEKHIEIEAGDSQSILNGDLHVPANTAYFYSIKGVGAAIDGLETVAFEYTGQIKNIEGTTSLVDTPLRIMELKEADVSLNISADDSIDSLVILFVNSTNKTYKVSTYIKLIKVG